MPAPNIDMIAASLRSCSLTGRARRATAAPPPHELEQTDESEVVTVELNSEVALPYHWEQCLDMRTGEVYYINWKDGTRTTEDPRSSMANHTVASYYSSEADDESSEEEEEDDDNDDGSSSDGGDTTTTTTTTTCSSGVSSVSYTDQAISGRQTLVAAGCKACFMYFMVPKHVDGCPKCGGGLLHLGRRNSCF